MVEIPLLFVGKLANNLLLASFPTSISEISPDFSFATDSCKGLKLKVIIIAISFSLLSTIFASDENAMWYRCIVKASSHKAFYTFKINTKPCKIYWQEIDAEITISECNLPIISGLKPSAQDKYSVVWLNLETGDFYDYLSGVKDRGKCTASKKEPAPWSTNR